MQEINIHTLVKLYDDGRITKKQFDHLHAQISQQQQQIQQQRRQQQRPQAKARYRTPPIVAPASKEIGTFAYMRSHLKSFVTLVGTISIFTTLAIDYYHDISSSRSAPQAALVKQEPLASNVATTADKEVNEIADILMRQSVWSSDSINDFTAQWIRLSVKEKATLKGSPWYQEFAIAVRKQVSFQQIRRKQYPDDVVIEYRLRALALLAETLNLEGQHITRVTSADSSINDDKASKKRTKAKKTASQKEKSSVAKRATVTKKRSPKSETKRTAKKKSSAKSKKSKGSSISGREMVAIVDQYVAAFEDGNTKQITALFADDAHLKKPLRLSDIRTQYKKLFRATDERWVDIRSLTWDTRSGESRGTGKLRTSLRLQGGGDYKTVATKVSITLRKIDNVTRIVDFDLQDTSVFALGDKVKAPSALAALRKSKPKPKYPTRGELQDIVTQYIDSYQSGDIRRMMELFSRGTWTTDLTGLKEMRNEYEALFQSTSDRQLFIDNMQWSFKNNKAMGTGDLVVTLISRQGTQITKQKGKVRMIVEKSKQKAQFSHLFHLVN
ncbi:hypothetical protein [Kaarinaea lacus]